MSAADATVERLKDEVTGVAERFSDEDGFNPADATEVERTAHETAKTRRQMPRVRFRNKLYNRQLPPHFRFS